MSMQRLLDIVAALRGENGCPWDREQTLESIKQHLVEECYELIEAIDSGEVARHREELGDILLQVALHSQIRDEEGAFSFDDVVETLCAKLIRRHPHVFGDTTVSGSDEVLRNWEAIKASEKRGSGRDAAVPRSSVEDVPKSLPALRKAHHVQARAARIGFDWAGSRDPLAAAQEEFEKLGAVSDGDNGRTKERVGDLLFALVNLGRERGVNAEDALNAAVDRFIKEFRRRRNSNVER